jgi:hypothetical protein
VGSSNNFLKTTSGSLDGVTTVTGYLRNGASRGLFAALSEVLKTPAALYMTVVVSTWRQIRMLVALAALAMLGLAGRDVQAQNTLIATNAVWRYLDDGSDQGTAWRGLTFDDAAWQSGPAELGYGDDAAPEFRPEATVLNFGPDPLNKPITYYFRLAFNVTGAAGMTNLLGRLMRDDGAVVYLNGMEVIRSAMPSGLITFSTLASLPGASDAQETTFFPFNIDGRLLREGLNVVAVEVHQVRPDSSDLSFAFELTVITNAPPPPPPGDGLVVPTTLANRDVAYGAGTLREPNLRLQEVYGSVHFPTEGALLITELRFRPDFQQGGAFSATIANIQINLSTTVREPDALSTTFAENVGDDDTVVFSGSLTVSSQFIGPATGPKEFDIMIPLSTPFLYDPGQGNLLLDVRNYSGSTASKLSGESAAGDSASRAGGSVNSASGGRDSGVDALKIIYTATNAPPRPPKPIRLARGPYLQCGTRSNIVVCWRTDRMTNSVVRFGRSASALNWEVRNAAEVKDHFVTLTNLAPDTQYFYAIGAADTNLAAGADFFFITAPSAPKPTRIWAMGDFGTTGLFGNGALAVRDAYRNFAGSRYTDLWLMLGDNAYSYGRDDDYQRAVFDVYPEMLRRTVAWSTIGNHETYGSNTLGQIAYYDIFKFPSGGQAGGIASGTIHYYSFDYGNIHLVCLDSELSDQTASGPMATWLQEDLAANSKEWLIAFWHSPPYSKGSHDSDSDIDTDGHLRNMREVFVPILEAYGVDLVLCGHSHNYERSYLMDGHYGKSWTLQPTMLKDAGSGQPEESGAYLKSSSGPGANLGAVYVVAGSAGFATFQVGRHPAMYAALLRTGSLVVDVNGSRLDGMFLRETGAIDDHFTILKRAAAEPLRFATFWVNNGNLTAQFKSLAGHTYRVEMTPRLDPPQWSPASSDMVATGATTRWTSPLPLGSEKYFFRVLKLD